MTMRGAQRFALIPSAVLVVVSVAVATFLVVTTTAGAVADGYIAERLARCHQPSETVRHLVQGVAHAGLGPLVAVRHRDTTYVAATVAGQTDTAVFGTEGLEVRAVNEVARDASTAAFDYLYGLHGQIVIRGNTSIQDGRQRAIGRVSGCERLLR